MRQSISEIEMTSFAERLGDQLTIDHPAFSSQTVLLTEPIKALYQVVRYVLLVRETGCCFTAPSGVGKTRALMMLEHVLRDRMPNLVVVRHTSWNHQVPSIRAFFKHFLTAVDHPELRGETFDLRRRLVCRLIDLARTHQSPFVVLLIDEAGALRIDDFLFLKDIYNDLDREGVGLITIMIGQDPDFSDVIALLREKGRTDLVSRFARRREVLRPLSTSKDVAGIFRQYDTSIWPQGSEQTWTKFFLPEACASGFTLESQTPLFFEALRSCVGKPLPRAGFPARQFFAAVRHFLTMQQHEDLPGRLPPPEAWQDAVEFALLADAVNDLKTEAKRLRR
jgi:hypothetical protein